MPEYFSFEKVLKELQLGEEELKRMVSEGQIRAFRDEDKMKFRKDDIDAMRKGRQTDPTIILPGSGVEPAEKEEIALVEDDTSETLLDLDEISAEEDKPEPAPVAAKTPSGRGAAAKTASGKSRAPVESAADTLDQELVLDEEPELKLEDEEDKVGTQPIEAAAQETFVDEEEVGMSTEPLEIVEEAPSEDAGEDKPKTVVASKRETQRAPARSGRVSQRPSEIGYVGYTVTTVAATFILFLAVFVTVDLLKHAGGAGGVSGALAKVFGKLVGESEWEAEKIGTAAPKPKADEGEAPAGDAGEGG
ncbi:MAG: hypothetical protein L0216_13440 [Planctomycetales bacterium]|nr:hypothetical protein [Planctomycetales bacterium]